jgi:hypothetical protein
MEPYPPAPGGVAGTTSQFQVLTHADRQALKCGNATLCKRRTQMAELRAEVASEKDPERRAQHLKTAPTILRFPQLPLIRFPDRPGLRKSCKARSSSRPAFAVPGLGGPARPPNTNKKAFFFPMTPDRDWQFSKLTSTPRSLRIN